MFPQLSQLRRLAFILVSDARLKAFDGDTRGALERCLLVDSVSRHVGDDTLISYLVSIAVRQLGRQCMQDVIGQAANDAELLRWLKTELATAEAWPISPVRPMRIEVEIMTDQMRPEKRDKLMEIMGVSGDSAPEDAGDLVEAANKEIADFIAALDAETLARARALYRERVTSMLTVMNSPAAYAERYAQLKRLSDDFDPNDPASRVAGAFMPAMGRIYTLRVRSEAYANATTAGVDICLRKAESGKLPAALPAGLPKDPFSGRDFEYELTDGGFVLRCRAKENSGEDKVNEYAFTVK